MFIKTLGGNIMKKSKKGLIALLATLVIGFAGVGIASEFINWGGEDNIDAIYQAVDDLDSQLTLRKRDLKKAEGEVKSAKDKLNEAISEKEVAANDLQALNQELQEKLVEIEIINVDLDATKNQVTERDAIISDKEKKVERQAELLQQYANALENTSEKVTILDERIKNYIKEVDNKELALKQSQAEVSQLTAEKEALLNENQALKASQTDTEAKLEKALNDVDMLRKHVENKVIEQANE